MYIHKRKSLLSNYKKRVLNITKNTSTFNSIVGRTTDFFLTLTMLRSIYVVQNNLRK